MGEGKPTTQLVLLRHGETDWNARKLLQGQANISLNARGVAQAQRAAQVLAKTDFAAVYASPLNRTVETARLVVPSAQVHLDERLMEINFGSWTGLSKAEVVDLMPDYKRKYANGIDFRRSPTGETLADVVARGVPAIEEIASRHAGQKVLVVSHGLLLNRVMHAMLGLEGRILDGLGNCCRSELIFSRSAWRLTLHNACS